MTRRAIVPSVLALMATVLGGVVAVRESPLRTPPVPPPNRAAERPAAAPPPARVALSGGTAHLAQWTTRFDALERQPVDGERVQALRLLVRRWAAEAPLECLDFLTARTGDPKQRALSQVAMRQWAQSDLPAAVAFAERRIMEDDGNSELSLAPLLEELGRTPGGDHGAEQLLRRLPQTERVYAEVTPWFVHYAERDLSGALAFAAQVPLARVRSGWFEMAGVVVGRTGGPVLLDSLSPAGLAGLSREMVTGMLGGLHSVAPAETERWLLLQSPSPLMDVARLQAAQRVMRDNPRAALALAAGIVDASLRTRQSLEALRTWSWTEPKEATDWAIASELPADDVASFLKTLADRPDATTYARRMEAADQMADPRQRAWQQWTVFSGWYRLDPKAASGWLDHASLPPETRAHFRKWVEAAATPGG